MQNEVMDLLYQLNDAYPKYYMVVIRNQNGSGFNTVIGRYDTYEEAEADCAKEKGDASVAYGTHVDYVIAS